MKSGRLRKPDALSADVKALVDALPVAAMLSTATQPARMPVRLRIDGATKAESSSIPATAGSITPIIQGARITSIAKR